MTDEGFEVDETEDDHRYDGQWEWVYDQDVDWLVEAVHQMIVAIRATDWRRIDDYRQNYPAIDIALLVETECITADGITETGCEHLADFVADCGNDWLSGQVDE